MRPERNLSSAAAISSICRSALLTMTVFTASAAAMERAFGLTVKHGMVNSGTRSAESLKLLSPPFIGRLKGVSLMSEVFDVIQRSSTVGELLYSGAYSNRMLNLFTAGMYEDHTSLCNGYLSRTNNTCEIHKYSGKFGDGVVVYTPNQNSSRYCYKTYYIKTPMN